jgi:eukaryotic-like serine/threonine-protein kinase
MTDLIDRLTASLAGRYQPIRELGRGGMATVVLARDLRHSRAVAIKVLQPVHAGPLGLERFLREIQIDAGLTHPHILPLHDSGVLDVGTGQSLPFFVMPYVEGESLRDRLRRERQLPLEDALRITCEVADALQYAHGHKVIHRDIKPENILLEGDHAVVTDFGIAQAMTVAGDDRLTDTGLTLGTPAYMSPEQAAGERELDLRTDIYSLGCVLYEMLAGEPPFTGATPQIIIARRLTCAVPSLAQVRQGIPASVEAAVQRALARTPADRFRTAGQLTEALRQTTPPEAAVPVPRRVPRRGRVVAVSLVGLLSGIGALWWNGRGAGATVASAGVNSVAVLPFRSVGPGLELWQEGMVDLLSINLDGSWGLRTIPARTVLSRWHRKLGNRGSAADQEAVLVAARDLGAARAISGSIVGSGTGLRLIAEMYDVKTGEVRGRAQVEGPTDSVPALIDRLSLELLRSGMLATSDSTIVSLRGLTTSSIVALKSFLQGEQALRRARPAEAVTSFKAAVEADSTFALAAYRLSVADGWSRSPHTPGIDPHPEYIERATRLASHLPAREALHVQGLRSVILGEPRSLEILRGATSKYPDDAESWYLLGDALFHVGGMVLAPRDEFRQALRRATELDPGFAPAYLHLAEDAFDRLDSTEVRRILGSLRRIDPSSDKSVGLGLAFDLAWGDSLARSRSRRALDTASTLAILTAKHATDVTPDLWETALAAAHALARQSRHPVFNRAQGEWGASWTYLTRGRTRESVAADLRGGALAGDSPAERVMYSHGWSLYMGLAGSPDTLRSREAYEYFKHQPDSLAPVGEVGLYAALAGDWPQVARWIRVADSSARIITEPRDTLWSRAYAQVARLLRAFQAERQGDRRAVLREMERRESLVFTVQRILGEPVLRFQAARRLYASGQLVEARRYFESFDNSWAPVMYAVNQFYLGQIAEELGQPEVAKEHYARTVRWWKDCDPELRPLREQARDALIRLTGESPGNKT